MRDAVSEVAGVEIGLEATDGENEFSRFDFLLDLGMRDGADIDLATVR